MILAAAVRTAWTECADEARESSWPKTQLLAIGLAMSAMRAMLAKDRPMRALR